MTPRRTARRALVSLHDVAPDTLDDCLATLAELRSMGVAPVTLLVVPGAGWDPRGLRTLRGLAADGYPLAGHGWSHRAPHRGARTAYHRLHAALISRDEAEHLSRPNDELRGLVRRCADWFAENGLDTPTFYVPPAWATGRLSSSDLAELPFRYYSTLAGMRDAGAPAFRVFPLVGYLADTRRRAVALKALNALNRAAARVLRRPLRVSIHPADLRLRLADDLRRLLRRPWEFITVEQALAPGPAAAGRSRGAP